MARSLQEILAEIERKAKENKRKTPVPADAGTTVCEDGGTVPESGSGPDAGETTVPEDSATSYEGAGTSPAAESAPSYARGETLLGTYLVQSGPVHGGMGSVWRVHHKSWNVDLAMKRPQAKLFQNDTQKEQFIHECETWINLGLHPNIVSCYYVRELDGVPTIFSEWMENGSLENTIRDGTLYEGTAQAQQERLLDIAIQFARGLHYAHEQGLIHQDVKPDNLLLSKNWDAKVADFGLARARAQLTVLEGANTMLDAGATVMAPSGGYTPAYCSMEQLDGKPLTRRTDIYSWAVSVMEMYTGSRPWINGVVAGLNCQDYLGSTKVPVPGALKELLAKCLAAEPEDRPHDFSGIEEELQRIYRAYAGKDYPRPGSNAAADTADSLNNRALSYLDMGKTDRAEKLWKEALEKDSSRFLFHYNYAVYQWNAGKISDAAFVRYLKSHSDGSALYQNTMDDLSRMRGNWDENPARYSYELDKRPQNREPLIPLSDISADGRYRVQGYARKEKSTYRYGYTIEDLLSGEIRDYPNDYTDYGKSTPLDGMHYMHPHFYKSQDVYFAGPGSELVVMIADALWFFHAGNGRLILSMPPETDEDGDSKSYSVYGYTKDGTIEYSLLGIIEHWKRVNEISLCPDVDFPYLLSGVESSDERLRAEKSAEINYNEALRCREKNDFAGVLRALNRSLEEQVLTLHGPSLKLWSELGAYYPRGGLVTVIQTEDTPTPIPRRNVRKAAETSSQTAGGKNYAENGQTEVILRVTQESQEYDSAMDMFEYCYSYSLTAKDLRSGETYFKIDNLEIANEADWKSFSTDRYLVLREDQMLRYSRERTGGEWLDLAEESPSFALPGGYWLKNTERGVDIGGFLIDDCFDDFRPLWNADVIACRKHNYRLVYRYLIPDEI